jgi:hypothetical protein
MKVDILTGTETELEMQKRELLEALELKEFDVRAAASGLMGVDHGVDALEDMASLAEQAEEEGVEVISAILEKNAVWKKIVDDANHEISILDIAAGAEDSSKEIVVRDLVEKFLREIEEDPSNPQGMRLQQAVARKFNLPYQKVVDVRASLVPPEGIYSDEAMDALADALYQTAQKRLIDAGVPEYVTIYRGVSWDSPSVTKYGPADLDLLFDGTVEVRHDLMMQPITPWSLSLDDAAMYSSVRIYSQIMAARVPRSRIISLPYAGLGMGDEPAIMVIGGRFSAVTMSTKSYRIGYSWSMPPEDIRSFVRFLVKGTTEKSFDEEAALAGRQSVEEMRTAMVALRRTYWIEKEKHEGWSDLRDFVLPGSHIGVIDHAPLAEENPYYEIVNMFNYVLEERKGLMTEAEVLEEQLAQREFFERTIDVYTMLADKYAVELRIPVFVRDLRHPEPIERELLYGIGDYVDEVLEERGFRRITTESGEQYLVRPIRPMGGPGGGASPAREVPEWVVKGEIPEFSDIEEDELVDEVEDMKARAEFTYEDLGEDSIAIEELSDEVQEHIFIPEEDQLPRGPLPDIGPPEEITVSKVSEMLGAGTYPLRTDLYDIRNASTHIYAGHIGVDMEYWTPGRDRHFGADIGGDLHYLRVTAIRDVILADPHLSAAQISEEVESQSESIKLTVQRLVRASEERGVEIRYVVGDSPIESEVQLELGLAGFKRTNLPGHEGDVFRYLPSEIRDIWDTGVEEIRVVDPGQERTKLLVKKFIETHPEFNAEFKDINTRQWQYNGGAIELYDRFLKYPTTKELTVRLDEALRLLRNFSDEFGIPISYRPYGPAFGKLPPHVINGTSWSREEILDFFKERGFLLEGPDYSQTLRYTPPRLASRSGGLPGGGLSPARELPPAPHRVWWYRVGSADEYTEFFPRLDWRRGSGVASGQYAFGYPVPGSIKIIPPQNPLYVQEFKDGWKLLDISRDMSYIAEEGGVWEFPATRALEGPTRTSIHSATLFFSELFGDSDLDGIQSDLEESIRLWQIHKKVVPLNIFLRKRGYDGIEYGPDLAKDGGFGNIKFPPMTAEGRVLLKNKPDSQIHMLVDYDPVPHAMLSLEDALEQIRYKTHPTGMYMETISLPEYEKIDKKLFTVQKLGFLSDGRIRILIYRKDDLRARDFSEIAMELSLIYDKVDSGIAMTEDMQIAVGLLLKYPEEKIGGFVQRRYHEITLTEAERNADVLRDVARDPTKTSGYAPLGVESELVDDLEADLEIGDGWLKFVEAMGGSWTSAVSQSQRDVQKNLLLWLERQPGWERAVKKYWGENPEIIKANLGKIFEEWDMALGVRPLQHAVIRRFNLKGADLGYILSDLTDEDIPPEIADLIIEAMYHQTQFYLGKRLPVSNDGYVTLYRGLTWFGDDWQGGTPDELREIFGGRAPNAGTPGGWTFLDDGSVHHSVLSIGSAPIASYSLRLEQAVEFAGMSAVDADYHAVIAVRVPISRILSLPTTGMGDIRQSEILFAGGDITVDLFTQKGALLVTAQGDKDWLSMMKTVIRETLATKDDTPRYIRELDPDEAKRASTALFAKRFREAFEGPPSDPISSELLGKRNGKIVFLLNTDVLGKAYIDKLKIIDMVRGDADTQNLFEALQKIEEISDNSGEIVLFNPWVSTGNLPCELEVLEDFLAKRGWNRDFGGVYEYLPAHSNPLTDEVYSAVEKEIVELGIKHGFTSEAGMMIPIQQNALLEVLKAEEGWGDLDKMLNFIIQQNEYHRQIQGTPTMSISPGGSLIFHVDRLQQHGGNWGRIFRHNDEFIPAAASYTQPSELDALRCLFFHEFGHGRYWQVESRASQVMIELKQKALRINVPRPTAACYAGGDEAGQMEEWFAEEYAMYRMGQKEFCTPELREFFEREFPQ